MRALTTLVTRVPVNDLTRRVRGEFDEMPGLRLTLAQACRMWALDAPTCETILGALVDAGFLTRLPNGQYARL